MVLLLAKYRPIFSSFRHIPPRESFAKLAITPFADHLGEKDINFREV